MSGRDRLRLAALGSLLAAILVVLVRIAGHAPLSLEIDRTKASSPSAAMLARIERLDAEVELVWYASPRAEMPAEYRPLEGVITELFRALERASSGRVVGRVVDPTSDPDLARHLAALDLAPFRARRVERDAWRERSVWSCLRIAYGPHGAATIPALGPEHLAGLQALIVAELDQLEEPRKPRIAVAAPDDYGELRRAMRRLGEIEDSDFESSATLPADADLFLWIDPTRASAAHLAALDGFLARGKSVLIAGSRWKSSLTSQGARPAVRFEDSGFPADALLSEFGLTPLDAPLLDARAGATSAASLEARTALPTHLVRAIGQSQDFRALGRQPNGSLLFAAPTAFQLDAPRLVEKDLVAAVLASSSESSFLLATSAAGVHTLDALQPTADTRFLGPQALLVLLSPVDPWRGSLVFAASSTPFGDEYMRHEAFAHEALAEILVAALASGERLAFQRAARTRPAPLAELGASERALWRGAVVLLVPLGLGLLALARRRAAHARVPRAQRRVAAAPVLKLACAAAGVLAFVRLVPLGDPIDLTRAGTNALAPETKALLARHAAALGPISIELLFSDSERLPPEFRPQVARAQELALRIARAVPGVEVRARAPAEDEGLPTVRVTSRDEEVTTLRRIHATIRVSARGEREELSFPDAASFERLEFRLAFAIDRLARGGGPRIAVASDVPRPAPSEALLDFQRKGLFAPSEGDVYSQARALLAAHDFQLVFVDPEKPALPADARLLVWFQPRRDVRPLLAQTARLLASGGRALIAAQHYVVRSRQRQEHDLELSLWPEPQYCDLDRFYFPSLGLAMPREVLFDELAGSIEVETRVERAQQGTVRERATSPVLIRAVAANFARTEPIVAGLSDLLFAFGNRLALDPAALAQHGLRARTWIETSERAWSFDWTGGDLPASVLEPPPRRLGRQPLAALVEGTFPGPEVDPELPQVAASAAPADARGRLLWIGCSEMFKNGRLHLSGYDHAGLLLAGVAELALEPELAAILAHRRPEPGFDWVAPRTRIVLRALVLGASPLLIGALALVVHVARTRRAVRIATGSPSAGAAAVHGA